MTIVGALRRRLPNIGLICSSHSPRTAWYILSAIPSPLIRLLSNGCVPYIAHPDLDTPCSCSRHRPQFLTHSPQLWTVRGRVHCACVFTLASRRSPCGYGCSITPSSEMTRSCQATPAYPRRAYRLTIQQYGMETDTGSANPRPGCHRHAMLSLSRLVRSPQGSCMLV